MTINQNTSKGIINWQGFSIGKGGSVLFNNGAGATLNRVTGSSMSSIAGLLKATGSLYLINPNGIVITSTGSVITGGDFIASTLNISDSDFLNGNLSFYGATGSVTNNGSIVSSGNTVLVGTFTTNNGTVSSSGTASMASGTRLVLIPENGPSGILISPSSLPGNVTNSGVIKAASVYLSSSGGNVYALAGNNGGLIEATGTKTINGQVWLTAPKGSVSVNSPITASGSGGTILIDGLNNYINSNSILNASGTGGVIKVGLFPSLPESLSTTLSYGATLLAGGINGKGFIDTSGDNLKLGNITVNANGGEWLLDPVADFTIDSTNNSTIDTALGSGNVTITTASSGTTTSPSLTSGAYNTNTGDINIDAPVWWSNTNSLTLSAYNSINVNSTITVSGGGSLALDYNTAGATSDYSTDTGVLNFPWAAGGGFAGSIQFTGMSSGNPTGSLSTQDYTSAAITYTLVNGNNLWTSVGSSGNYALATSIIAPSSIPPIDETGFTGIFNGLGNTITGLTIGSSSAPTNLQYAGLFGQVGSGGSIENIGITNEAIYDEYSLGFGSVGGLAGLNSGGTISNSYSTGSVTTTDNSSGGDDSVGGLAGYNSTGTISNSYSTGSVTNTSGVSSGGNDSVGGLAGYNTGTISNSDSTGSVINIDNSLGGDDSVGGLAGYNTGAIEYSYSLGSVTNTDDSSQGYDSVGGLAGYNTGTISKSNSYSTDSVTNISGSGHGGYDFVGGLAGYNSGTVSNSYSTGSVTNTDNSYGDDSVGGLAGANVGTISNSYLTGSVTNTDNSSHGYDSVGGLAGYNGSIISNSYSTGSVTNTDNSYGDYDSVGGLAGDNAGTISNSDSTGSVTNTSGVSSGGNDSVGGLAGYNTGTVSNSYSTGSVTTTDNSSGGDDSVGGLAGYNSTGTISNSYSTGSVTNTDNSYSYGDDSVGGLAGYNTGTVSNSYSTGSVTNTDNSHGGYDFVGGLAGDNAGTIEYSYSTGSVTNTDNSYGDDSVGGLAGYNTGTVSNSYSTGSVTNTDYSTYGNDRVGGLAGYNNTGTISNSYSTGSVTITYSSGYGSDFVLDSVGGLAGYNNTGTITDSYWDTTTSGQSSSAGGTGLTDAHMKLSSYFTDFNITTDPSLASSYIWFQYDGNTYPLLRSFMTPLTVSADATVTYNGRAQTGTPTTSYSIATDTSDISGTLTYTNPSNAVNAGTYNFTNLGGLYSNQQGYIISYVNGTLTINPADINITANSPAALTYNGSAYSGAPGYTVTAGSNDTACPSGLCDSDSLTGTPSYSYSQSGTSVTPENAGSYSIGLTGLSNNNYSITYVNGALTINPETLTYNAVTDTKTYNGTSSSSGVPALSSGTIYNSDTIGVTQSFNSPNALGVNGSTLTVNTSGNTFTSSGNNSIAGDYAITAGTTASGTINPASLTVTAAITGNPTKTYDGTTAATLASSNYSLTGFISGQGATVNQPSGTYSSADAGSETVTASLVPGDYTATGSTLLSNYVLPTSATGTGTINPAALTVTANNDTLTYNDTAFTGGNGVTYSGLVNGETPSVLSGSLTYSGSSQNAINAGTYTIIPGGLTDGNYTISYVNGNLIINPAALTVTANNDTLTYNDTAFTGGNGITATGLQGSDTLSSLGTPVYSGSSQGAINAGTYVITPKGLTDGNYTYTYVNGALTINPAALTVTANNFSYNYDGTPYSGSNGVTYSGLVNGETPSVLSGALTYSGSSQGAVKAGSYAIIPGGLADTNYAISFVNGTLTINPVYSSVFQALQANTPSGISGASGGSLSALNAMLAGYEGSGLLPSVPAPYTGWHIYLKGLNQSNILGIPYGSNHKRRHSR